MRTARTLVALSSVAILLVGCRDTEPTAPLRQLKPAGPALSVSEGASAYSPEIDQIRQGLLANGITNVELASAEISVAADSTGWDGATTLIANNRTHTLTSAFVPNDPRRGGGSDITYIVDQANEFAFSRTSTIPIFQLTKTQLEPEIDASMQRWQNEPNCGAPVVTKVPYTGVDPDLIDGIILGIPSRIGTNFADITQAGWLSRTFFDRLAPGGSRFILGVTFAFVFIDNAGVPTDIDHDGRADVAFREIYYNRGFFWTTDATFPGGIDIQSVATHESGHAFGLGHFGKVFVDSKGTIKYASRAVMNAVYVSSFRDLAGTDNASFCQLWANTK